MKLEPRKEPKQARSRAMVDAILDAVTRVLVARGYAKTNTNLVAEEAGISVGSLYQYFPNKDALIVALRERHVSQMLELFRKITARPDTCGTLQTDFEAIINALVSAHLLQPELNRILNEEFPASNVPVDSEVRRLIFEEVKILLRKYKNAMTVPDLDLAAFVIIKMLKALVNAVVLSAPDGVDPKQIQSEILPAVIGYLTAPRGQGAAAPAEVVR